MEINTATTSARLTVVCMDTRRLSCLSDSSPLICAVAYAFAGSSFLIGLVRRDTL